MSRRAREDRDNQDNRGRGNQRRDQEDNRRNQDRSPPRSEKSVERSNAPENYIRVNNRGTIGRFVSRGLKLFNGFEDVKPYDTVFITATDNAIPKANQVAQVIRQRIAGLHLVLESTLVKIEKRTLIAVTITLTTVQPKKLPIVYAEVPIPESEIKTERPSIQIQQNPARSVSQPARPQNQTNQNRRGPRNTGRDDRDRSYSPQDRRRQNDDYDQPRGARNQQQSRDRRQPQQGRNSGYVARESNRQGNY